MGGRGGIKAFDGATLAPRAGAIALCLVLANCASSEKFARNVDPKYGVASSPRVVDAGQPVPKGGGAYRIGKPYVVAGVTYTPEENEGYSAEGLASWYGDDFHGRLTANGEIFDMNGISAAHPTLPMPCYVRVTNLGNRRSIIVRVNDRGPYHGNRVIDLSHKTADLLGFKGNGVARVRVEYVGRASLDGTDDRKLVATLREGEPAPAPSAVRVAAARPFVDLADDPAPSRIRGQVPLPSERPYTLGQDYPQGMASRGLTDVTAARIVPREPDASPVVSAYAASRTPAAFVSGRGLY
jgi:peptidoglycan lytic transglycosylase